MVIHMTRADGRRVVEDAAFVRGYDAGTNQWDRQRHRPGRAVERMFDATSRPALEADSEELNLDWTCSATRCRPRASLPTDAGYGPRGEARADARDCLYCGWARRALSVRDTGH